MPEWTGGIGEGPAQRRRPTPAVPRIGWSVLGPALDWRQGEHVTLVGPTGCGKTTLALDLLPRRRYVAVVATKPRDPLISDLSGKRGRGYSVVREWPPPDHLARVLFWPPIAKMTDADTQQERVSTMLRSVYRAGGWCVYLDELRYVTQTLGLRRAVEMLWLQGRSLGLSLVGGTQRPSWVPLEAYDQATHLFLWRETDGSNLKRLGEIGGVDTQLVRHVVPRLDGHDVLYVNTRTGNLYVTNAKE